MSADEATPITRLLIDWRRGDQKALDASMPLVYDELRRIASAFMSREREGHTGAFPRHWGSRGAANPDSLRSQPQCGEARFRRGSGSAGRELPVSLDAWSHLLALDDALSELTKSDERKSQIVEMKHLGGLTTEEIAGAMGISVATVDRELPMGAAYLRIAMSPGT